MKNKGFTLVEIMLAVAIVVVISGAMLVSISQQRDKARATRMLSEISAAIQPIYMCVADGEDIDTPGSGGGGNICDGESAYGQWPAVIGNYYYSSSPSSDFGNDRWCIKLTDGDYAICCNSHMTGCVMLDSDSDPCDRSNP